MFLKSKQNPIPIAVNFSQNHPSHPTPKFEKCGFGLGQGPCTLGFGPVRTPLFRGPGAMFLSRTGPQNMSGCVVITKTSQGAYSKSCSVEFSPKSLAISSNMDPHGQLFDFSGLRKM